MQLMKVAATVLTCMADTISMKRSYRLDNLLAYSAENAGSVRRLVKYKSSMVHCTAEHRIYKTNVRSVRAFAFKLV